MPKRRAVLRALFAVATAPLVPAAARAQTAAPKIRLGVTSADQFAEAYFAQDGGFFSKSGLNVEIVGMTTGGQISTAVAAGAVDIGMSNTAQLVNAIVHGAPFVVIAGGGMYSSAAPGTALVVAKDSPIRTAHDLEGKTCSVTALKDITQIAPTAWMEHAGADPSKTKFVEIPFAEVPAALARGTIDAGMLAEPWLSGAEGTTVRVLNYAYSEVGSYYCLAPWFTTADYYRQNADLVHRFTSTIYDAARWANSHHPETAVILTKYSKFELAQLQHMNRALFATSLDPAQLQPVLTMMYKYGAIDKPLQADAIVAKL